jgi:hypothetical protein
MRLLADPSGFDRNQASMCCRCQNARAAAFTAAETGSPSPAQVFRRDAVWRAVGKQLEIGANQGRLQFGNLSDRLCAELPRTRIRHSRRNWQRRPTANPRVDVNQARELHLSSGISLCRRRFGHAEPSLLAQQCDDLRLWRSGVDCWTYLLDVDAILRQYGARPQRR